MSKCFWPSGCANSFRCQRAGKCIARMQRQELLSSKSADGDRHMSKITREQIADMYTPEMKMKMQLDYDKEWKYLETREAEIRAEYKPLVDAAVGWHLEQSMATANRLKEAVQPHLLKGLRLSQELKKLAHTDAATWQQIEAKILQLSEQAAAMEAIIDLKEIDK